MLVIIQSLKRASWSIPLNIAEGCGKLSNVDKQRFHSIARGSAMECGAILDVCLSIRKGRIYRRKMRE
jgi:four helix bundle protein